MAVRDCHIPMLINANASAEYRFEIHRGAQLSCSRVYNEAPGITPSGPWRRTDGFSKSVVYFSTLFNGSRVNWVISLIDNGRTTTASTSLCATNDPPEKERIVPNEERKHIPKILYLDAETGEEPFLVELVWLTAWIREGVPSVISHATALGDSWHHVVALAVEMNENGVSERIGLAFIDIGMRQAAGGRNEQITLR
ncbi:hypothetical protein NA57DRAFT_51759 [Rhizodiscina lignyota]|uniref:Uncharacterized protein n=1 Tax=Rhizodiscina lignyota TaxID=1504668 RepID=A0A9P4IT99_9PEZI|nr:hypothetical protein NA57DRAFT_51759 [Rhizodiscina lignyota]